MVDSSERPSLNRRLSIFAISLTFIAIVGGLFCRLAGASGELWLDEIWSVLHLEGITNPLHILTRLHHDNNHLLNSLWIWLCGFNASPLTLRIPSIIFGVTTIVVILRWGRVMNEPAVGYVWALLLAFSYPFILTDSEARGYALCILCTALCFYHVSSLIKNKNATASSLWFGVWASLGCFTHATFALFLAPTVVWMLVHIRSPILRDQRVSVLLYALAPPLLVGSLLTFVFYSRLQIGGGTILPYFEVAASTVSVAFGGEPFSAASPEVSGRTLFLVFFLLLIFASELRTWGRSKDPLASLSFFVLAAPILAVAVGQPHFILARYLLIPLLFLYLVFARFLARMYTQGKIGSVTAIAILTGYLLGNISHTAHLALEHRSHFNEIFSFIVAQSSTGEVSVGGTQDFKNGIRLRYAVGTIPETTRIVYEVNQNQQSLTSRFFIAETFDAHDIPPDMFTTHDGTPYKAIKRYPAPALNGSHVTLYERKK